MKYFLLTLKAVFIKDVVTEFRSKQFLPTMIVLGMLIVWILRITSEAASIDSAVIGPAALWIALLFSGLLAQERTFAIEQEQDCINGLLLAPIDVGTVYIAKLAVNVFLLLIFEIIIVPMVILSFKLDLQGRWLQLIAVLLLGNIAISSVGTLFSAMVQLINARGSLLSIIVLVILMPVMIPSMFALLAIFNTIPDSVAGTGILAFVGTFKSALGYMVAFDAVFFVISWLLFPFAIKE